MKNADEMVEICLREEVVSGFLIEKRREVSRFAEKRYRSIGESMKTGTDAKIMSCVILRMKDHPWFCESMRRLIGEQRFTAAQDELVRFEKLVR